MNTKEKILKNALKLFVKQGIDTTSTAQICKQAGIASGTLFVHFKTKQDLIDTLYLERKRAAMASLEQVVDEKASVEQNVLAISKAAIEYYLGHFDDFQFCQLLEKGPRISSKANKLYMKEKAGSLENIKRWQDSGQLKSIETWLLMDIWWSMLSAFIRDAAKQKKKKVSVKELMVVWDALKK